MKKRFEYLLILFGLFIICLNFVSAAPSFISIPANSSIFYGNQSLSVNFNASPINTSFGNYSINNTNFSIIQTGSNATLINATPLSVGNYAINVTINDSTNNKNWTIYTVQVNKSNYGFDCAVYFNATNPQTYPAFFIAYTNCSSNYTLTLNSTMISNGTTINSGATAYNLTVQRTDTANYTNIFNQQQFIINPSQEKFKVLFNASTGINYPDTFLALANSTSAFVLKRNGSTISNNSVQSNGAGYFNFSAQRTDTANYTYTYNDTFFTVNKKTSVVETYINNSAANFTLEIGASVWLNGTLTTGVLSGGSEALGLLVDEGSQNNSNVSGVTSVSVYYSSFTTLGFHNVTTSYTGNQNYTSSEKTFNVTVNDTTAPTYSLKSVNNTEIEEITNFAIYVNDNSAALHPNNKYVFSTNNTGSWVNDSGVNFTTTPSWANVTKTLNSTVGMVIGYRWYFNDSSNNKDSTPTYILTTTADTVAPTYSGDSIETTYAGRANAFTIDVTDNVALQSNGQYIFSTNNNGSWVNDSAVTFTANSEVARSVKTLNSTVGKVVSYRWYFSDNAGNMNSTPIYSLTTIYYPGSGSSGTTGGGSTLTTYAVDEQFSGGTGDEYNLKVSDKISFAVSGSAGHSLTVKSISSTTATVEIASTPIFADLQKGVLYSFDISGDSVNDLRVRYDGLVGGKASIFMQEILPVVTPPAEATPTPSTPAENTNTNPSTPSQNTANTTPVSSSKLKWNILIIVILAAVVILAIVLLKRSERHKKKKYY